MFCLIYTFEEYLTNEGKFFGRLKNSVQLNLKFVSVGWQLHFLFFPSPLFIHLFIYFISLWLPPVGQNLFRTSHDLIGSCWPAGSSIVSELGFIVSFIWVRAIYCFLNQSCEPFIQLSAHPLRPWENRPLSGGDHFVSGVLQGFVYARLASFSLRGYPCIDKPETKWPPHDKVLWRCKCSVFLCKHSFPLKQNVSEVSIGHVNVSGGVSTTRKWSAYIPVIQGLNYFPFNIESVLLEYSLNTGENADPPFKLLNHEFKMALVSSSSFNWKQSVTHIIETYCLHSCCLRFSFTFYFSLSFVFFSFLKGMRRVTGRFSVNWFGIKSGDHFHRPPVIALGKS